MSNRILITRAHVISQDPQQPDGIADVLIQDGKIARIGLDIEPGDADVIDGSGQALLPGFVDTHRHTWQGAIRQTGIGWDFGNYRKFIQNTWGPNFTPDDVYVGNLLGAAGALDAGITTLRDESHIQNSPDHTDQAIAGLQASGIRGIFAYGWPSIDSDKWMLSGTLTHPDDIRRVRRDLLADDKSVAGVEGEGCVGLTTGDAPLALGLTTLLPTTIGADQRRRSLRVTAPLSQPEMNESSAAQCNRGGINGFRPPARRPTMTTPPASFTSTEPPATSQSRGAPVREYWSTPWATIAISYAMLPVFLSSPTLPCIGLENRNAAPKEAGSATRRLPTGSAASGMLEGSASTNAPPPLRACATTPTASPGQGM